MGTNVNIGRAIFQLGYELSPIILTNGIASLIPGQMLPIIAITQATTFLTSLISGNDPFDTNQFFARFRPLPGATLINNAIGDYPFANQTVAANAIIAQPLNLSMMMDCPAAVNGGYLSKLITFTSLKKALDTHNQSGGTYTIATPSYVYTNCILTSLRDISRADSQQVQHAWQFDFVRPLLSLEEATFAQQALNSLMSNIAQGLPQNGTPSWSGLASTVGGQAGGIVSSAVTGAKNLIGTAVSNVQSTLGLTS